MSPSHAQLMLAAVQVAHMADYGRLFVPTIELLEANIVPGILYVYSDIHQSDALC